MKASIFFAAASVLLAPSVQASSVIMEGSGFGTYYYDIKDTKACYNDFTDMNSGYVECNMGALSLNTIKTNNLVAMNHTMLAGNLAKYCGKRVIVSVNGVPSSTPFFIGDGCERCGTGASNQQTWDPSGAPGLDFSYEALNNLSGRACSAGHIDITWEITDETLFNFDTNAPGVPNGPVDINVTVTAPVTVSRRRVSPAERRAAMRS